jgi:hypothetical protein
VAVLAAEFLPHRNLWLGAPDVSRPSRLRLQVFETDGKIVEQDKGYFPDKAPAQLRRLHPLAQGTQRGYRRNPPQRVPGSSWQRPIAGKRHLNSTAPPSASLRDRQRISEAGYRKQYRIPDVVGGQNIP